MPGSSARSIMNGVRRTRPISRDAASRSFRCGKFASKSRIRLEVTVPADMVAATCKVPGQLSVHSRCQRRRESRPIGGAIDRHRVRLTEAVEGGLKETWAANGQNRSEDGINAQHPAAEATSSYPHNSKTKHLFLAQSSPTRFSMLHPESSSKDSERIPAKSHQSPNRWLLRVFEYRREKEIRL